MTAKLIGEVDAMYAAIRQFKAKPGSGQFLARQAGKAAEPLGRATVEFNPKQNFGAKLR